MNPTTQFLYTIRATRQEMITDGPTSKEAQILSEHSEYLEALTKNGTVILYGRTQNNDETTFGS